MAVCRNVWRAGPSGLRFILIGDYAEIGRDPTTLNKRNYSAVIPATPCGPPSLFDGHGQAGIQPKSY